MPSSTRTRMKRRDVVSGERAQDLAVVNDSQLRLLVEIHLAQGIDQLGVGGDRAELLYGDHDLARGEEGPLALGEGSNSGQGEQPAHLAFFVNQEVALVTVEDAFLDDLVDGGESGHGVEVAAHHLGDGDAFERFLHGGLLEGPGGGILQEPADEDQPQAVEEVAVTE